MSTLTRVLVVFLGFSTGCLFPPKVLAAHLPGWAHSIARRTPPLEDSFTGSTSRVLFSETRVVVRPNGTLRVRRRLATQALAPMPGGMEARTFGYGGTMKIESSRAWHRPARGRVKKSRRTSSLDLTLSESFLTDQKTRFVLARGEVKRGSLVFFEFVATDEPYTLSHYEYFLGKGSVVLARFELETPPGWSVQHAWLRQPGPDPVIVGNVRTWEIKNLPAPEEERLGQSAGERAPILVVNFVPAPGADVKPAVLSDWSALSQWYEGLAQGRDTVTPEIAEAAKKVMASAGPELFERLRIGAHFVRDSVRYLAIELGIGGYQPHPAELTLRNQYGDCKDKSTLYQSILAAVGIQSYPVLISLGEPDTVSTSVASPHSFNHLIVAVPLPADSVIPDPFAHAIVQAGELGPLLFVDTTDEYTSFGSLSAALIGNYGLVVAGPRGRLVKLPGEDPAAHRIERRLGAEMSPDRTISAVLTSEFFGQPATWARSAYRQSSEDRRKAVEREIRKAWHDVRVEDYAVEYETVDGRFVETVTLKVAPLPESGANASMPLFPGARDELPRVPLSRRKTAVVYRYPRVLRFEMSLSGLPDSAKIPSPRALQSSGWSVTTSFSRDTDELQATWEVRLSRTRFEPEAFQELRRLWSAADSTARTLLDVSIR